MTPRAWGMVQHVECGCAGGSLISALRGSLVDLWSWQGQDSLPAHPCSSHPMGMVLPAPGVPQVARAVGAVVEGEWSRAESPQTR